MQWVSRGIDRQSNTIDSATMSDPHGPMRLRAHKGFFPRFSRRVEQRLNERRTLASHRRALSSRWLAVTGRKEEGRELNRPSNENKLKSGNFENGTRNRTLMQRGSVVKSSVVWNEVRLEEVLYYWTTEPWKRTLKSNYVTEENLVHFVKKLFTALPKGIEHTSGISLVWVRD